MVNRISICGVCSCSKSFLRHAWVRYKSVLIQALFFLPSNWFQFVFKNCLKCLNMRSRTDMFADFILEIRFSVFFLLTFNEKDFVDPFYLVFFVLIMLRQMHFNISLFWFKSFFWFPLSISTTDFDPNLRPRTDTKLPISCWKLGC